MTDRPLGDSELDAAIDRAVRDLMGAEPRADLRERVLSELAGGSARATLWPRFAFAVAAATAAIVIGVQLAERPGERPVEPILATLPVPGTPIQRQEEHTPIPPRTWVRETGPSPATSVDDRPIQAASIETALPPDITPLAPLARLASIEPIAVSRLEASVIPTPAINIKPLAIEPMEIAPLTPPR